MLNKEILPPKQFDLMEIDVESKEIVDKILASSGVISNFTCFEQLFAYLDKPTNNLYVATVDEKQRIILHRNAEFSDVRIFFKKDEDEELLSEIKRRFAPQYIGYNLIKDVPESDNFAVRNELILDINSVAELENPRLRREYNRSRRAHSHIYFRAASRADQAIIQDFLQRWHQRESEKIGKEVSDEKIQHYIDLFLGSRNAEIGLVIDGSRVIGITSGSQHPSDSQLGVSTFSMVDRGYTQLGVFTKVEQARSFQEKGFSKMLIGGTEGESKTKFKMRFMQNGSKNTYYSEEVYKDEKIDVDPNYLRDFWA